MSILHLAIPCPLRRGFDYLPPKTIPPAEIATLQPGTRILVPFGSRKVIGILLETKNASDVDPSKLKAAIEVVDKDPIFDSTLMTLCSWAASYYHHPIGDCFAQAMPSLLRKPAKANKAEAKPNHLRLTTLGQGLPESPYPRAPKQAALIMALREKPCDIEALKSQGISTAIIRALIEKKLIEKCVIEVAPSAEPVHESQAPLTLNSEQQKALTAIHQSFDQFGCFLLEGVTGSGKTEVYLQLIAQCIAAGKQTLVLIPEISLTPQTASRFKARFGETVAILHSGLTDSQRLSTWQQAKAGQIRIVIGTRSAVFTPLQHPGLIIVDEEHDLSYKQQDGWRYSARDLAVKRANLENIPIVLGSATPSLETLQNALDKRYQHLRLTKRAGNAAPPSFSLLDIKNQPLDNGLSEHAIKAIGETLKKGNQALVFVNRRGFSPTLLCHDCGWHAQCPHCDARLTVHFQDRQLRCHHCGHCQSLASHCSDCHSTALDFRGPGTERLELSLKQRFNSTNVIRIDRDTTQRKGELTRLIAEVDSGQPAILVGTQMLAKGHHFPNITLVVILDVDGGLFSGDFRGPERMGQLIEQVAGRAGRAEKLGRVIMQSHHVDHPLLLTLTQEDYHAFARQLLKERKLLGLPPFHHMALIRAEANNKATTEQFLNGLRNAVRSPNCMLLGPLPSPMARKNRQFRSQLILNAKHRADLHRVLAQLSQMAEQLEKKHQLRWSIDVDPADNS